MTFNPPIDLEALKGFLEPAEAEALFAAAVDAGALGPALEIGSYCGKSTICLGLGMREHAGIVYALDHHRGSEEHQLGEFFHDPELFDSTHQQFDTFGEFRRNIDAAGLTDSIVPIVASSTHASRQWSTPLGLVFIDGGHSLDAALEDYRCWSTHIARGGILAIHDLYPDAAKGGQAPIAVYRMALASGLFAQISRVDSLGLLRRL